MEITQEKLNKFVSLHNKWQQGDSKGKRMNLIKADFSGADLNHTDLRNVDLQGADLRGVDLQGADLQGAVLVLANLYDSDLRGTDFRRIKLYGANLQHTILYNANLQCADLRHANLNCANLNGANLDNVLFEDTFLNGAILDKTYYQVVRIGSRNATTTYCVEDDRVFCGCWKTYKGGSLAEFKKRIKSVYGKNGKNPNKKYYTQYMAAIKFFKKMAKLVKQNKESDNNGKQRI